MYLSFYARPTISNRYAYSPIQWPWDITILEKAYCDEKFGNALQSSYELFAIFQLSEKLLLPSEEELRYYLTSNLFRNPPIGFLVAKTSKLIIDDKDTLDTYKQWFDLISNEEKCDSLLFFASCDHIEEMLIAKRSFLDARLKALLSFSAECVNKIDNQCPPELLNIGIVFLIQTAIKTKQFSLVTSLFHKFQKENNILIQKIVYSIIYPEYKDIPEFELILSWATWDDNGKQYKKQIDNVVDEIDRLSPKSENINPIIRALCAFWLFGSHKLELLIPLCEKLFQTLLRNSKTSELNLAIKEAQKIFTESKGDFASKAWMIVCCQKMVINVRTETEIKLATDIIFEAFIKQFIENKAAAQLLHLLLRSVKPEEATSLANYFFDQLSEHLLNIINSDEALKHNSYFHSMFSDLFEDFIKLCIKNGYNLISSKEISLQTKTIGKHGIDQYYGVKNLKKIACMSFDHTVYYELFYRQGTEFYSSKYFNFDFNYGIRPYIKQLIYLYRFIGSDFFVFLKNISTDSEVRLFSILAGIGDDPLEISYPINQILVKSLGYFDTRNFLLLVNDARTYSIDNSSLYKILADCDSKDDPAKSLSELFIETAIEHTVNSLKLNAPFWFSLVLPILNECLNNYPVLTELLMKVRRICDSDFIYNSSESNEKIMKRVTEKLTINRNCLNKYQPINSDLLKLMKLGESFWIKLKKTNEFSEKRHKKDCIIFIMYNLNKIANIFACIGNQTLDFLSSYLTTSLLPLERFLDSYLIITPQLTSLLKRHLSNQVKWKFNTCYIQELEDLLLVFSTISEIQRITSTQSNFLDIIENIFKEYASLSEVKTRIKEELLILYLGDLATKNISGINKNFITNYLGQILIARRSMKNNNYESVFDEIIRIALFSKISFTRFFTDINQDSLIGKTIAMHNANIKQKLQEAGIDVAKAFNYKTVSEFTYEGSSTSQINRLLMTIMRYSQILKNQVDLLLTQAEGPFKILLGSLNKTLLKLHHEIFKGEKSNLITDDSLSILKKLTKESNRMLLKKCNSCCSEIKTSFQETRPTFLLDTELRTFIEYANHLEEGMTILDTALKEGPIKTLKAARKFRVQAWDKDNIETLFLGNYVGCCLATNGAQFPALVQRWMDQAMFFHVVFEADNKDPVALIWLFFAEDEAQPGQVNVVANFFEIKASLGRIGDLNDLIAKQLMLFTGKYARDIGAINFIIRPLRYGLFVDSKVIHQFGQVTCHIKKVGGCLQLNNFQSSNIQAVYYLDALNCKEFYHYSEAMLLNSDNIKKTESSNTHIVANSRFFKPHSKKDAPDFVTSIQAKELRRL